MMNHKMMVALVGALSLLNYTPYANAQDRARGYQERSGEHCWNCFSP